jgi:hypothetical protein
VPDDLWAKSRSGSHAGRGFHYQDAVATELAVRAWRGELSLSRLIPEGLEDISLELETNWLHLQAKSRREHRGEFTLAELSSAWRHLAERLIHDEAAHAGLVLERPLANVEGGPECALATAASADAKQAITQAVHDLIDPDEFLARTHLIVMPSPEEVAVELLAARLQIPPATCVAHQAILRGKLASLADENGVRAGDSPAELTVADIARLLDDVNEAIDPAALEQAVRDGIAETVDFATPIQEDRFYSGVDVVAGHIVAGLPVERPEAQALLDGLVARRHAIAVGPSGAGKSALIWLAAYASRHSVRWYRVRRLGDEDVPALVRLVKALAPTGAQVGFIVDDLGREDRAGYDRLAEELRNQPAALILAACREEDLLLIRTAIHATQVRPSLTQELAERIWRELHHRNSTPASEWREAYKQSKGLLLEYGHLLTEGTRLAETVAGQVNSRIREHRALELDVLALVATADSFGADIDVNRLTATLAANTAQMKEALARLIDEHLIQEHEGSLGGLHELRSRHVMEEIHRQPPPTLADSIVRVIDLVHGIGLQPFVIRVLLEGAIADEVIIEAVAARLQRELDPRTLAAVLHALRLVGFRRMVAELPEILTVEGVGPAHAGVVLTFAIGTGEHDILPHQIQRAINRVRELQPVDLRVPLVSQIAPEISIALASPSTDTHSTASVLATLGELDVRVSLDAAVLARVVDGAPLAEVRMLLEAAFAASKELAVDIVRELGGSPSLLERVEREQPWVRDARIGPSEDGRVAAYAEYAYVAESSHQPDPHDAVVELARYLLALAPEAALAVCRAIDVTGETAGLEIPIAKKAIDRENLPTHAEIAWNRARIRAATAAVAYPTDTAYLLAARDIVQRSTRLVRRAGDTWARGKPPSQALIEEATTLANAADMLAPAPTVIETIEPLDEGSLTPNDAAGFLGTMIATNLFPNLFSDGDTVAPLIPQLVKHVDELMDPDRWDLLAEPPLAELSALRENLNDLRAVLAEDVRSIARKASGRNRLAIASHVARDRAAARMQHVAAGLEQTLADTGFSARVLHCELENGPYCWPSDDFLVLVEMPTLVVWRQSIETLAGLCRPALQDRIGFQIAPIRNGKTVSSFAAKVFEERSFPDTSVSDWPELPFPLLDEPLGDVAREALGGLNDASAIVGSVRRDEMHPEELAALESAHKRAHNALNDIEQVTAGHDDQLLAEVQATLGKLAKLVDTEIATVGSGGRVDRSMAASMLAALKGGDRDDIFFAQAGMLVACAEWDVEPAGAWARVGQASDTP